MAASNEAEPDQLDVARAEGDAYGRALKAMDQESGAVTGRAGDYLVAFVQEEAEGMFLWHPFLHHYGTNAVVPDEGPYTVTVSIAAPGWMRHDPVNGNRYSEPVEIVFADQRFDPGRKPSPDAQPRGPVTGVARSASEQLSGPVSPTDALKDG